MVAFPAAAGGDEPGRVEPGRAEPGKPFMELVGTVEKVPFTKEQGKEYLSSVADGNAHGMAVSFVAVKGKQLYEEYCKALASDPNSLCFNCFTSGLATGYSASLTVLQDAFGVSEYLNSEELLELKRKLAACGAAITTASGASAQVEACLLEYQDMLLEKLRVSQKAEERSKRAKAQSEAAMKLAESLKAKAQQRRKQAEGETQGESGPSSEPQPPQS